MMTQARKEWLAERRSGIGGSEAAAILGLSPWGTPVSVWLDKTGQTQDEDNPSLAMLIGTELEELVARLYQIKTGNGVHRFSKMIHKGCLLGNLDRLVIPEGEKVASHKGEIRTDTLLECKTASREWGEDGVPIYYQTQVQHYMGLAPELQHADVACLFIAPGKDYKIYRVERDQGVIDYMQERLTNWWSEYVEGNKMPPPINEEDCKRLWARSNPGKSVRATADIEAIVNGYRTLKAQIERDEQGLGKWRDEICGFMQDAETLTDAAGRPLVTWKSNKDSTKTDWKEVAREAGANQATIDLYTKTTPGARVFKMKEIKAAK